MDQGLKQSTVIGGNIRRHRMLANLTQEQISAKLQVLGCDVSRGILAKIETGIRHISVEELEAMMQVLPMQYADFFAK